MPTIIVFSHLRWDFVFQRPQQLLSRLARHYRILFVEEPVFAQGASYLERASPATNVTVCRPHTPLQAAGFHDDQIASLQALLATLVAPGSRPIVWFYTPMALPLLRQFDPALVVYDCMDELAAFKNPPKQLLQRESALLNIADLVLAGGPSLYEAKRRRHPNVVCLPSSVDVAHFARARERSASHLAQVGIPTPRLGFYGVIDERFDSELIAAVADARPHWQLVMVGPVVKIAPGSLPRRPNIHYLGQCSYQELPAFLAGWDVCLLPFARNEATRYISPTKVLEYMAAELPIVSTPITDVERPYGHLVAIGPDAATFVAHCEAALQPAGGTREALRAAMRETLARTSWTASADAIHSLLEKMPVRASAAISAERATAPGRSAQKARAAKAG